MIGEALATACADRGVLARIGGPVGEAARAGAATLATLSERDRRLQRAMWAAIARAPVPPGIRGIDASWIEAALLDLPPRARDAVAGGNLDEVSVWLARWACAALPALPAIDPAAVPSLATATQLSGAALRAWLEDLGAEQLAFALGDPRAIAGAAAIVGDRVLAAADRIAGDPARLGPRRAAIARCQVTLDDRALFTIGARTIAPRLDALTRRQLAHRVPRSLGRLLMTAPVRDAGVIA